MPRRRPSAIPSDQAHWLTVSDNTRQLFKCLSLPAGTDTQQALREEAARWVGAGWQIDGDMSYGFCFIQHGAERRLIKLCRADPTAPAQAGHAFLAGNGSRTSGPDEA
jgi:hypothetical protein